MYRTPPWFVRGAAFAFVLGLSCMSAANAQTVPSTAAFSTDVQEELLDPGEFVWHPETAPPGSVEIVVSLPLQVAYVYRAGSLIGVSTVSTGKPGYDTPTGTFTILEKKRDHRSNLYDAPMPFMQRLTWDGIALHAGAIPGEPASHGCVRLPDEFARKLFAETRLGATVHIVDEVPDSPAAALTLATGLTGQPDLSGSSGTR
jgi:lipoprotein-anchoring transpeptidase ErfK/SrfK